MKIILAAALTALVCAGTVGASSQARDPRVPALQRQVNALSNKVNSLTATFNSNVDIFNRNFDLAECRFVKQIKFNIAVLDVFNALLGEAPSGLQPPSDNGACARAGQSPPRRALQGSSSSADALRDLLRGTGFTRVQPLGH